MDQRLPARLAFGQRHLQRAAQGVGQVLGAVGVDQQGFGHLFRRPGKARQDQHPGIGRVLCRDIFLGDQVHPVAQRGDHADPRGAIDPGQHVARVALVDIADRHPVQPGMGAVDPSGQPFQRRPDPLVAFHRAARGRGDLQQHHFLAFFGVVGEIAFIAEEAFFQPLGIVEPVNPDDQRAPDQAFAHPGEGLLRHRPLGHRFEGAGIDPDRAGEQPRHPPAPMHRAIGGYGRIHLGADEIDERVQPFAGVKTDHVIGEQRFDQRRRFGQGGQQPARRPRDVEEEPDPAAHAAAAQLVAQRDHVIVLHPHHVVRLDQRQHRIGKPLVGALVAAGEAALVLGQVDAIVEQRPQRAVGIAVVVFLDVLLFEVDRGRGHAVGALEVDQPGELVGHFARPAEPDPAMGAQRRRERDGQPALRSASGADAVGDHHQPAHRIALHGRLSRTAQLISPTSE